MVSLFLAVLSVTCQSEIHFEVRKLNVQLKREVEVGDICSVDMSWRQHFKLWPARDLEGRIEGGSWR